MSRGRRRGRAATGHCGAVRPRVPRRRGRHRRRPPEGPPAPADLRLRARRQDGKLKGSGRSIPGFHLRDALDLVAKRHPDVLLRFGGHAMAAGCTLDEEHFDTFDEALQQVAREWLDAATLQRRLLTDGPLAAEYCNAETVATLDAQVWGQAFEQPMFCDVVDVVASGWWPTSTSHSSSSIRDSRWTASGLAAPIRCRPV
jgi:hypothetical protein